jgi:hypothetical protein
LDPACGKNLLTSKMPCVLIEAMYRRVNDQIEAAHRTTGGLSPRAQNLSLDLLCGSGSALLLLTGAAGSG